jgi:hypothetical protein
VKDEAVTPDPVLNGRRFPGVTGSRQLQVATRFYERYPRQLSRRSASDCNLTHDTPLPHTFTALRIISTA